MGGGPGKFDGGGGGHAVFLALPKNCFGLEDPPGDLPKAVGPSSREVGEGLEGLGATRPRGLSMPAGGPSQGCPGDAGSPCLPTGPQLTGAF